MTDKTQKDEYENAIITELFFQRQEKAISECQIKYGKLAFSVSYNILHSREDAEECVNDAMLGLWNSIPPERPRSLVSYLCSLVRNISLNRYDYNHASKRNRDMDEILEELEGVLASPDWEEQFREGEVTELINAFLAEQKEKDRVIFVRRYYYSDPVSDIARAMGDSEGAIAMRLSRMRIRLRKKLEKEGISI